MNRKNGMRGNTESDYFVQRTKNSLIPGCTLAKFQTPYEIYLTAFEAVYKFSSEINGSCEYPRYCKQNADLQGIN